MDTPLLPSSTDRILALLRRLRAPDGCPWDQAQTPQSIQPKFLEETLEVLESLDQLSQKERKKNFQPPPPEGDLPPEEIHLKEELGDLLLHILFQCEFARERQTFDFEAVCKVLEEKLIRRHPHVFQTENTGRASSPEAALERWKKAKSEEKATKDPARPPLLLDDVPRHLPGLMRSAEILDRVSRAGFDWETLFDWKQKFDEEWKELQQALEHSEKDWKKPVTQDPTSPEIRAVGAEIGDLFFCLSALARSFHLKPETLCHSQLDRFQRRFRHVEHRLSLTKKTWTEASQEELNLFWNEAKTLEPLKVYGLTGLMGAGKSTLGKLLKPLGVPVLDADEFVRHFWEQDSQVQAILEKHFGTTDRSLLRKRAFENPSDRVFLEELFHPLVAAERLRKCQELASQGHALCFYEASLLVQKGQHVFLDGLIVVEASYETRKKRLLERNPEKSESLLEKMIAIQGSEESLRQTADFFVKNEGSLADLEIAARALYALL